MSMYNQARVYIYGCSREQLSLCTVFGWEKAGGYEMQVMEELKYKVCALRRLYHKTGQLESKANCSKLCWYTSDKVSPNKKGWIYFI